MSNEEFVKASKKHDVPLMKLNTAIPSEFDTSMYLSSVSQQALGIIDENGDIKAVTKSRSCREGFATNLHRYLEIEENNNLKKACLIVQKNFAGHVDLDGSFEGMPYLGQSGYCQTSHGCIDALMACLKTGIHLINIIEEEIGWSKSQLFLLDSSDLSVKHGAMRNSRAGMVMSSRRWVKAPPIASLWILLLTAFQGPHIKKAIIDRFINFEGAAEKVFTEVAEYYGGLYRGGYIRESFPKALKFLKAYPELFRKRKMYYYWNCSEWAGYSRGDHIYSEGIGKFLAGQYECPGITKKAKELGVL